MMRRFTSGLIACLFAGTMVAAMQQGREVAPGLSIPYTASIPWALDTYAGGPELVPVHHSTVAVDNHRGSNLAKGMVFGKQKMTTQLDGVHAATRLHTKTPVFFIPVGEDDPGNESKDADTATWAIVQAQTVKDHRVLQQVSFTAVTLNAKRQEGVIEVETTRANGLLKLTPKEPMAEGEYAIVPLMRTPNTFATRVFDFGIEAGAPEDSDVVKPK